MVNLRTFVGVIMDALKKVKECGVCSGNEYLKQSLCQEARAKDLFSIFAEKRPFGRQLRAQDDLPCPWAFGGR
jgi:hypothetical protein